MSVLTPARWAWRFDRLRRVWDPLPGTGPARRRAFGAGAVYQGRPVVGGGWDEEKDTLPYVEWLAPVCKPRQS